MHIQKSFHVQLQRHRPSSYFYAKHVSQSTGQLPNLMPKETLRIGDFGFLNDSSGDFTVQGNIFDEGQPLFGRQPEVSITRLDSIECGYFRQKDHSYEASRNR